MRCSLWPPENEMIASSGTIASALQPTVHGRRACVQHHQALPRYRTSHRSRLCALGPGPSNIWATTQLQQQQQQHPCIAAAIKTDPTASWTSSPSADEIASDQSRGSQQEEYVSQAAAQQGPSAGGYNWLEHWYPVGFIK